MAEPSLPTREQIAEAIYEALDRMGLDSPDQEAALSADAVFALLNGADR